MSRLAREQVSELLAVALLIWFRLRVRLPWVLGRRGLLGQAARRAEFARRWPVLATGSAAQLQRLFARACSRPACAASCLPRSLALARFLQLHGLPAQVCLGLARVEGRLAGHAWVEHDCAVLGDAPAFVATFARLQPAGLGREGR